ncbi:hypothetical protein Fleli_2297 [Bernardetia litoralis DSM 6794]|uniref:SPOR domain-containing protein n=1 Tax=Bernardetia litoralis (strain ATCC 23117 / DSM 6794 / NBRC 15988 / NCIMB 1366 / Fx l1 / Sio-4) TaxID=880071 RepID=I4AL36_BERLS|nr:SPOR domain-containing protein [Bernardetia litoralis]AFM04671.1 hypothetical protein Fleli_2297 [Bernardetia litoralis DSM 6794]
MKKYTLFLLFAAFVFLALNQTSKAQAVYNFPMLVQEQVEVKSHPLPSGFDEKGDTTLTVYSGLYGDFSVYFVNGPQYHHILNPNPTGLLINGKEYSFYCDSERGSKKNISNFLDIYEFEYLGRKYICFFSFREDCLHKGCLYRCYNLFDVTDPNNVSANSFASIYGETFTFGDYNSDGVMDFIRVASQLPPNIEEEKIPTEDKSLYGLVTVFSFDKNGKAVDVKHEGNSYYLFIKGTDEEFSGFEVVQNDWFIPLKDQSGKIAPVTPYFAPYVSFDPKEPFLYDAKGYRVPQHLWAVQVAEFDEIEGALDYCEYLMEGGLEDVFVYIDQYNRDLHFLVLAGNYQNREKIQKLQLDLKKAGVNGRLINMKTEF